MSDLNDHQKKIQANLETAGYEVTWIPGGYTTSPDLYDESEEATAERAERKAERQAKEVS
jgi:hypothetical protein